ncbi:MAG: hypothetical protein OEZ39_15950 [Gammaproteobacteria bacterium]|nr:hypothetical protein [Gammaproteobacteria bacterium]MDH5653351.1 hypothetical protein [Gammaproteobacteria bacterium]
MMQKIKRLAALLVMVCFFLPLAQCQWSVPVTDVEQNTPRAPETKPAETHTDIIIAVNAFRKAAPADLTLLMVFLWPLLAVLLTALFKSRPLLNSLIVLSPFLCAFSLYYMSLVLSLGKILYGGYLWILSMFVFTGICLIELVQLVKQILQRRGQ